MHRALSGLALFGCLMASGWAWLAYTASDDPVDVTGTYFRIVNTVDRDLVCATTDSVAPGGMRVHEQNVQFPNRTCSIAQRQQISEQTTEGPWVRVELDLVCQGSPLNPDGLTATLHVRERAELTTYIAVGDDDFVPGHATFMACPTNNAP